MSQEEALKVAVEFQAGLPTVADRSIDRYLDKFTTYANAYCPGGQQKSPADQREFVELSVDLAKPYNNHRGITKQTVAQDAAVEAFLRGNISNAVDYSEWALNAVRRFVWSGKEFTGYHAIHSYQKAYYLAYAGDLDRAEGLYSDGTSYSTERW